MELKVEKENAIKAWKEGNAETKKVLENLYGKEVFNMKITDRVKTFEDAYEIAGKPQKPDFNVFSVADRSFFEHMWKMTIITKALNEDWEPDWDNTDEPKYYPYFSMSPSGFGFRGAYHDFACAPAGCGSRLRFRTSELARYAGEQFVDIWKAIQLG
mgnify:CR=1 FL=1|jgi:hypothetical protein